MPDPLPTPPDAPLDPVGVLHDRITRLTTNYDEQLLVLVEIDKLRDEERFSAAVPELLQVFMAREDVLTVRSQRRAKELLGLLGSPTVTPPDRPVVNPNNVSATAIPTPRFTLPLLEWLPIPAGKVTLETDPPETYEVQAFQISKYPVTHAQFQAFIDDGGYKEDRWWAGLAERETAPAAAKWPIHNHPRENVNWYEAVAFTRWLSVKTGLNISLPTEMQWQRAAQGDDGRSYPWGKTFDQNKCNTYASGIGKTTPVDRYPQGASPFGVLDISGNVWEWTLTEFGSRNSNDLSNNQSRSLRGGSWGSDSGYARAARRSSFSPDFHYDGLGFRVACSAPVL